MAPGYCPRCGRGVEATWPWGGWVSLRKVWFAGLGVLVVFSPVWFTDMAVMMPSVMIFIVAIGPLNALARTRPTCLRCGGVVEATRFGDKPSHD